MSPVAWSRAIGKISYRRSDALGHARARIEYPSGRFGAERIFFDRSTIEGRDVFPDTLREGVRRAPRADRAGLAGCRGY
jgi:hypothetical protein